MFKENLYADKDKFCLLSFENIQCYQIVYLREVEKFLFVVMIKAKRYGAKVPAHHFILRLF